mmetsp:Transcript_42664/g.51805  ORF Transcript_42664/g.51805 Transcript_42664/m.51805 type:complete len:277 (-) Transcript_42664:716-1546(-)
MELPFELPPRLVLEGSVSSLEESKGEGKSRTDRKSGTKRAKAQPWSEEEHLCFLVGLTKLGKGNWSAVSRYYVPSRTPAQVASHAQKHFIRLSALHQTQGGIRKRKSRFSVLDAACGPFAQTAPQMNPCLPSPELRSVAIPPQFVPPPPLSQPALPIPPTAFAPPGSPALSLPLTHAPVHPRPAALPSTIPASVPTREQAVRPNNPPSVPSVPPHKPNKLVKPVAVHAPKSIGGMPVLHVSRTQGISFVANGQPNPTATVPHFASGFSAFRSAQAC